MAEQKIELVKLEWNVEKVLVAQANLKDNIIYLREQQAQLRKEGKETSLQYIKNEATIKNLTREYNNMAKVTQSQVSISGELLTAEQALDRALKAEIVTEQNAIDSNKELRAIRKTLNATTEEGAAAIAAINAKIDENDKFIKANGSSMDKQRANIGNYKNDIKDAAGELDVFNGGLGGFIQRSQAAGGAGNLISGAFTAMRAGILGAAKAGLAFIATPIGAFIAGLAVVVGLCVGAFKFMTSSLKSTEDGSNRLAKATAGVTGVFNGFWKIIKPIGEWMGKVFLSSIESIGEALGFLTDKIADGLEFVGLEDTAKSLRGVKDEIVASSNAAVELAKNEALLQKMQRNSRKIQLEYQKDAEKLRQQRDDESKSIEERTRLNEQLGETLKKQAAEELKIAYQRVTVAKLRIASEGKKTEALDALAQAETEVADIQERIAGQESEQLLNLNSLRKEARDKEIENQKAIMDARQKVLDDAIKKMELELQLYEKSSETKLLTYDEEIKKAEEVYRRKLKIANEQKLSDDQAAKNTYAQSKKTGADLAELNRQLGLNELTFKNNLEDAKIEKINSTVDATITESDKQLAHELANSKTRLDNNKFVNDEALKNELARLDQVAEYNKQNLDDQFINNKIAKREYDDAIKAIDAENQAAKVALQKEVAQADLERRMIDLENMRAVELEGFQKDYEIQVQQLELKRQAEVEAAEKTGADINLIDKKYAKLKKDIERDAQDSKVQLYADAFGNISTILGKESAAGKAFAIFQATADTYVAANKALAAYPPPFSYIAAGAAIATGIGNVQKIASTSAKFEDGGMIEIGGKRHSAGGTKFYGEDGTQFEAERGELIGVLNRNASAAFMGFNNAFLGKKSVNSHNYLANGGIVNRSVSPTTLDYDLLADKIGSKVYEANQSAPVPVLKVTDLMEVTNETIKVRNAATH